MWAWGLGFRAQGSGFRVQGFDMKLQVFTAPFTQGFRWSSSSKPPCQGLAEKKYLEGHGDLASGFITGMIGVITWLIGVLDLLITKSP